MTLPANLSLLLKDIGGCDAPHHRVQCCDLPSCQHRERLQGGMCVSLHGVLPFYEVPQYWT